MTTAAESIFTKEELRRLEIDKRLYALRLSLPYVNEIHVVAAENRQKILDEIKSLEEELDAIRQGQLILK
jgi:uncharacterized protein Smg (DUF494 family)